MAGSVQQFDVIIAGLGAMGCRALWQVARRGTRVLGLDAFSVPNKRGSSHGQSRAFRLAYFEHPGYVPLLKRSLAGWRELESATGGLRLLTQSGGLYIGRPDSDIVSACGAAARLHGLEHEVLDEAALRRRWPQFAFFEAASAVYEPQAGVCEVEATLEALARLARSSGAELHEDEAVLDWALEGDGVKVVTQRGSYRGRQLLLCPGAFAASLLKTSVARITPTRQVVGWFAARRPERAGPDHFPVWATEFPDGQFWYGFAALPGSPGLKLGRHQPGRPIDPLQAGGSPGPGDALELLDFAARWLPQDAGALSASSMCIYENSADGHFIIDWHPDCPPGQSGCAGRVLLACGGSGHAFKFTPVLGELLAELLAAGCCSLDIGFLSLDPQRRAA